MAFHIPSFLAGSAVAGVTFLSVHQQLSYRNRLSYQWPWAGTFALSHRLLDPTRDYTSAQRQSYKSSCTFLPLPYYLTVGVFGKLVSWLLL